MLVTGEFKQAWEDIPEFHRTVLSIFKANAFGGMIFLTGSRINHSCIPNLNFAYNGLLEKGTFHAVRDIAAGEELTVMYIDGVNRPRTRRQSELLQWGFLCICPACEDTPAGDLKEKRRLELFLIDQVLAINELTGAQDSARGALQLAQKMAGIQKSEGLLNRALKSTYRDAAMYSLKLGNTQMALLWAEKALEVERYCVGENHPDYQKMLDTVGVLEKFNTIPELLSEILAGLID
ncbi:TPR domain protein [Penicillium frequentans]|uniref:TPR domain protein n=1 Tax=Penicillium frequentans TaxID=3151616 RepID=A0AAD6CU46_9EURO|nr:TPR domain protein [Penicillium glabrum]